MAQRRNEITLPRRLTNFWGAMRRRASEETAQSESKRTDAADTDSGGLERPTETQQQSGRSTDEIAERKVIKKRGWIEQRQNRILDALR